ncbi:MAG: hypothetical protein M3N16_00795, partial [Actinomycetota bacterium]|nr:hypothetical protein [Actinomycetota bacterium]
MNRRHTSIVATGLAVLSLAACGEDEPPAREEPGRPEAREPAPPPATTARSLRQDTEALLRDLTETGRRVAGERRVSEDALRSLEAHEKRARELAARARRDLPERDLNRRALAALNDSLAGVASRLQALARSGDPAARREART